MAGYWPRSFFFVSLWTLTSSWSINMQKTNLANNPYLYDLLFTDVAKNIHRRWVIPENIHNPPHLSLRKKVGMGPGLEF